MVQINFALKEINCKIVYYGPGLSGKTTNLEVVHSKAPKAHVGELTSIATEGDRTLFFDFLPLNLGPVAGMTTKFQIYTVPGQVYYNSTRKLVLQGADGIVFVADSRRGKMDENLESLANLEENLRDYGMDINAIPLVFQYNKRDLPDIYTIEELQQKLNRFKAPYFEAVAVTGEGVFPTLKKISQMILETLNRQGSTVARPAQQAKPEPVAAQVKAPARQPVAVGVGAGSRSPPVAKASDSGVRQRTSSGAVPEREPKPAVIREQVAASSDVKKIERRAPDIAARVRKKPPPAEVAAGKKGGSNTGVIAAVAIAVIVLVVLALWFGGVLG